MSLAHDVGVSVRKAMAELVPASGAALTPALTRQIKMRSLELLKLRGHRLHASKVRLVFTDDGQPNLIISPRMLLH